MTFGGSYKNNKGFSFAEFALLSIVVASFVRLAVPNFYEFRLRAADSSAYSVYKELKSSLISEDGEGAQNSVPTTLIFNQQGEGVLPPPFSRVTLSEHMRINYVINLHYPGYFDLAAIEVSHDLGRHYYRLIAINSKIIEQVIDK